MDEEAEAGESRGWCWKRCECDIVGLVVVVVDNGYRLASGECASEIRGGGVSEKPVYTETQIWIRKDISSSSVECI